jgi:2-polyprenyl-3-methyl-5-hydroxy-6-metoxy-1,4-benzoquinol methylase
VGDLRWSFGVAKRYRDIIEEIVSLCPEGRVLDVGFGTGSFIVTLLKLGLHAVGMEPNKAQAAYAQEHGLTVVNDLLRAGLFDERFDVITFLQVLE